MEACHEQNRGWSGPHAGCVGRAGVAGWLLAVILLAGCDSKPPVPAVAEPEAQAAVHEAAAASPSVAELAAGMVNPGYEDKPEWFANSFLDIREDVAEAQAHGKRVLLYFYQDGCPYCKKLLDTNFALADTEQRTRDNFDVIAINMWGDREVTDLAGMHTTEKEFAKQLRVMFTPTLLFLDEQGRIVLRLNGYYPPHKFNAALDYGAQYSGDAPDFRATWHRSIRPRPAASCTPMHPSCRPLPTWTRVTAASHCWCCSNRRTAHPAMSCTRTSCSARQAASSWRASTWCCSTCGRMRRCRARMAGKAASRSGPGT